MGFVLVRMVAVSMRDAVAFRAVVGRLVASVPVGCHEEADRGEQDSDEGHTATHGWAHLREGRGAETAGPRCLLGAPLFLGAREDVSGVERAGVLLDEQRAPHIIEPGERVDVA